MTGRLAAGGAGGAGGFLYSYLYFSRIKNNIENRLNRLTQGAAPMFSRPVSERVAPEVSLGG